MEWGRQFGRFTYVLRGCSEVRGRGATTTRDEGTNQCCHFFGHLPLRKLSKTLLTSTYACVNNLEEQLPKPRDEDENCTVCDTHVIFSLGMVDVRRTDGLGRQVTPEWLVAKEYVVRIRQWTLLIAQRTW